MFVEFELVIHGNVKLVCNDLHSCHLKRLTHTIRLILII